MLALCAACLLFVAPLHEFEEVRRSKHVGERPVFPLVCMWANSSLWVIYGLCVGDFFPTVITNLFGFFLSVYYCAVYAWAVEPPSRKAATYNMFAATFLAVCVIITFCLGSFSPNPSDVPDSRVQQYSGVAASTSTALQYAAPLAQIVKVIGRRSTEGLSWMLASVSLLCASLWLWYGMVTNNFFIYVPNILGVAFSTLQCCLFGVYPRKRMLKSRSQEKIAV